MLIFLYTFVLVLMALVIILGFVAILTGQGEEPRKPEEGKATAAMCTTRLLETCDYNEDSFEEDFVVEQDLVYTYDSINL